MVRLHVCGIQKEGGSGPVKKLCERSKPVRLGSLESVSGENEPESWRLVRLTEETKPSAPAHVMPRQEQGLDPFLHVSNAPRGSPVMEALKDKSSRDSSFMLPGLVASIEYGSWFLFSPL